jgi:hypothetical protein
LLDEVGFFDGMSVEDKSAYDIGRRWLYLAIDVAMVGDDEILFCSRQLIENLLNISAVCCLGTKCEVTQNLKMVVWLYDVPQVF